MIFSILAVGQRRGDRQALVIARLEVDELRTVTAVASTDRTSNSIICWNGESRSLRPRAERLSGITVSTSPSPPSNASPSVSVAISPYPPRGVKGRIAAPQIKCHVDVLFHVLWFAEQNCYVLREHGSTIEGCGRDAAIIALLVGCKLCIREIRRGHRRDRALAEETIKNRACDGPSGARPRGRRTANMPPGFTPVFVHCAAVHCGDVGKRSIRCESSCVAAEKGRECDVAQQQLCPALLTDDGAVAFGQQKIGEGGHH
eukprot:7113623-Prymnesium_polylepis.1